jgi:HEAT repeat protein
VADELIDLALKLARQGFDEHVDALVEEAGNDETVLALAAAQVSTEPPMQSGSVDQIAYSLLVEALQRASISGERSASLNDVA